MRGALSAATSKAGSCSEPAVPVVLLMYGFQIVN